ncbi:MAG: bifunctional precorrin-2 dehydrogenase/sirohydrochlorin ferrochelatase [Lachnospiraceae bacterium]|nr:bifunctional precorrin-2 dehydrogenase/sirohydrochlorin ferrochelatase [Lachnospiraceae bacterium]
MAYFPMFIDITNEDCLVVGGGKVALRKIKMLMDFDAKVSVIAKQIDREIKNLPGITYAERIFSEADLKKRKLVFAATDDRQINEYIATRCHELGIMCNVADNLEECSFICPAYLKEGDVVAAFSTGGNSPYLAQHLKEQNKEVVTEQIGQVAKEMAELRGRLKRKGIEPEERKETYRQYLEEKLKEGK